MTGIRAVLFDLDNTLYEYAPCNEAGKRAVIRFLAKKLNLSEKIVLEAYEKSRQTINGRLRGQAASHSRLLYLQTALETLTFRTQWHWQLQAEKLFWKEYLGTMALRPGIKKLLQNCRQKGWKIVLVSDLTSEIQIRKVKKLRIARLIDFLVTSEEAGQEKPSPGIVELALEKLGLSAEAVVLVGDSDSRDKEVAKRCRIPFLRLAHNSEVESIQTSLFSAK